MKNSILILLQINDVLDEEQQCAKSHGLLVIACC